MTDNEINAAIAVNVMGWIRRLEGQPNFMRDGQFDIYIGPKNFGTESGRTTPFNPVESHDDFNDAMMRLTSKQKSAMLYHVVGSQAYPMEALDLWIATPLKTKCLAMLKACGVETGEK